MSLHTPNHFFLIDPTFKLQKLRKCVNTPNFLCTNLNYKKTKMCQYLQLISNLSDTACTKSSLWLNLNYKMLVKCASATNVLCTNLNYQKLEMLQHHHHVYFYLKLQKLLNFANTIIFYAWFLSSQNCHTLITHFCWMPCFRH